jgi:hypothetical protein
MPVSGSRLRSALLTRNHWVPWTLSILALALVTAALTRVRSSLGAAHVVLGDLVVVLGASARGGLVLGLSIAELAFG